MKAIKAFDTKVLKLILGFILLKLAYIIQSLVAPFPRFNRLPLDYPGNYWSMIFMNNDSGWYEKLVENGYPIISSIKDPEALTYAFFPLFPYLGKVISFLFGTSAMDSIVILANVCSLLLIVSFYKFLVNYVKDKNIAFWSSSILFIFPHHFYFSMAYTESLFLLLVILSFNSLLKEKYVLFGIFSSLLIITRINGVFFMIPMLIFHLRIHQQSFIKLKNYLIFVPATITLFAYLIHIHEITGYFFGFKYISELNWQAKQSFPFSTIYKAIAVKEFNYLTYNAFYALIFFALSFRFLARKEYDFFLLCMLCILIPLYEGSTISQPRFISVIFPFSLLIGTYISKYRYKNVLAFLLIGLHLYSFHFWQISHQISF